MAGKCLGWLAGRETVIKSNCDHSIDHKFSPSSSDLLSNNYLKRRIKLEFTFGSHRFNSLANGWLSRIHGMIKLFTTRRRGRKGNANDNHLHRIGNWNVAATIHRQPNDATEMFKSFCLLGVQKSFSHSSNKECGSFHSQPTNRGLYQVWTSYLSAV